MGTVAVSNATEWAHENVTGNWITLPTPFTDENELDGRGLEANVGYATDIGVTGLTYNWGTGEYWALTVEERKRICETVEGAVTSEVFTGCHVTCDSIKETIELVEHAEAQGTDLLILNPPSTFIETEGQLLEFVQAVADATELGIAYCNRSENDPSVCLSIDGFDRLVDIPEVCVVKDTLPNPTRAIKIFKRIGDRAVMSQPHDAFYLLAPQFDIRPQACFANVKNALFDTPGNTPYLDFIEAATHGNDEEMREIYDNRVSPINEVYDAWWARVENEYVDTFPIPTFAKPWMDIRGLTGTTPRAPLPSLTSEDRENLREDLEALGLADTF